MEQIHGACEQWVCHQSPHLALVGFPDDGGPDQVAGGLALGLLLLGLALEGQGLLEVLGDLQPVEPARLPHHGLGTGRERALARGIVWYLVQFVSSVSSDICYMI